MDLITKQYRKSTGWNLRGKEKYHPKGQRLFQEVEEQGPDKARQWRDHWSLTLRNQVGILNLPFNCGFVPFSFSGGQAIPFSLLDVGGGPVLAIPL
jgi:hypothetical protein